MAPSINLTAPLQVFNSLIVLQQKQFEQAIAVLDQSPTVGVIKQTGQNSDSGAQLPDSYN